MRKKRKQVNLSIGRGEKSKTGGLTAKGRAKYNRATGSKLKAPVTKKSGLTKTEKSKKKFILCKNGWGERTNEKTRRFTNKKSVSIKKMEMP